MSQWGYVVAAYALTWVVLAVYAVMVVRRARGAEARLRDLGTESEDMV